jgi:hypothetical protein
MSVAASGAEVAVPGQAWMVDYYPAAATYIADNAKLDTAISWRRMLRAHLVRNKANGGRIISEDLRDVMDVRSSRAVGAEEKAYSAALVIPNSFDFGDAAACGATAEGVSEEDAIQRVCQTVLTELILRDTANRPQSKLCLSPKNWKVSPQDLLTGVSEAVIEAQVAAGVFESDLAACGAFTCAESLGKDRRGRPECGEQYEEREILNHLRRMSRSRTDGWVDTTKPGRNEMSESIRLLKPGSMLGILRAHGDEFEISARGNKLYKFRLRTAASGGSSTIQPTAMMPNRCCPPAAASDGSDSCNTGKRDLEDDRDLTNRRPPAQNPKNVPRAAPVAPKPKPAPKGANLDSGMWWWMSIGEQWLWKGWYHDRGDWHAMRVDGLMTIYHEGYRWWEPME